MQFLFHGEERDFYPYRQSCRHDGGGEARVPLSVRGFLRDVAKATALEKKNTFHSRIVTTWRCYSMKKKKKKNSRVLDSCYRRNPTKIFPTDKEDLYNIIAIDCIIDIELALPVIWWCSLNS